MKILLASVIGLIVVGVIVAAITVFWGIGILNDETKQSLLVKAKQVDNTNEYDNCWKSIAQSAQVTEAQAKALTDIAVGYAQARTGTGGHGSLIDVKAVHEVVPNLDAASGAFKDLMNIIVSKRDGFAMRQKELIDLNRAHDVQIDVIPGGLVCKLFGRQKIDIKIVTSTRTDNAFTSGLDDNTDIFTKNK